MSSRSRTRSADRGIGSIVDEFTAFEGPYAPRMLRALLLLSRWIAAAHDRWRNQVARRRPLSAEVDLLRERLAKVEAENDLLRARLRRLGPRHRPRYRPWERLSILCHQARHGLSLRATARAFVVLIQTLVTWHREVTGGAARLVNARRPLN